MPRLNRYENFRTFPASLDSVEETRLQQQHRRLSMPIRDSKRVISTAISATGWLVTATSSEVRLYDLDNQNRAQELKRYGEFSIEQQVKNEKIRSVAISDNLLAVVTHCRMIVYELHKEEQGRIEDNVVENVRIDQNGTWTPNSVSILQVKFSDARQSAAAWIAVGGEGVNGVKLFQYSHINCWERQSDCRTILKCSQSTSSVRDVGFSQFVRMNRFIVFGVTSDNRIFCWDVRPRDSGSPTTACDWELDSGSWQDAARHRGKIASVSIFESPSGRPYIFCAVDQRHGSEIHQSFIAPMEKSEDVLNGPTSHWKALPKNITGRYMHAAAVTSNGRFLVTVEDGRMRLLTLHGAYRGGLTCQGQTLKWDSTLRETAKEVSGISLSVRECQDKLEIYAVDGRGHILFARVTISGMPVAAPPCLIKQPSANAAELLADLGVTELGSFGGRLERADSGIRFELEQPNGEGSELTVTNG